MVGQMRNMAPNGSGPAVNPRLTLSGSGLEISLAGVTAGAPAESTNAEESEDRLARVERTLKLLSARIAKMDASLSQSIVELEAQLGTQSEIVESLRSSVQQNEEMLETLADSMNIADDLGQPEFGLELVMGPATIAS
jgi:uncharacterized coiled-coil protein SlyX